MITAETTTAEQDQDEAAPKFSFSLAAAAATCCVCHEAEGSGKWQLCDSCRRKVAEAQAARERSRPAATRCVCCHTRFLNPRRGVSLCLVCRQRFESHC